MVYAAVVAVILALFLPVLPVVGAI